MQKNATAKREKEREREINDFARAIVIATVRSLFFAAWKSRFSYCHCRFAPFDYFDPRPSASVEHAYMYNAYRYECITLLHTSWSQVHCSNPFYLRVRELICFQLGLCFNNIFDTTSVSCKDSKVVEFHGR